MHNNTSPPYLSVVIPVYNEEGNLRYLTDELIEVLESLDKPWELIYIDDGSEDGSRQVLRELKALSSHIRVIAFRKNCGQTAALDAGFKAAQGEIIVTMDADLQNDPHDIPGLLQKVGEYDAVCGWRQERNDPLIKRVSSRIANSIRRTLSGDTTRDVGCALKAFKSDQVKGLKLYHGMHRFFPTLIAMEGGKVVEVQVSHRPRRYGTSKYSMANRIVGSFMDLLAVCWMKKRRLDYEIEEDGK